VRTGGINSDGDPGDDLVVGADAPKLRPAKAFSSFMTSILETFRFPLYGAVNANARSVGLSPEQAIALLANTRQSIKSNITKESIMKAKHVNTPEPRIGNKSSLLSV